MVEILNNKQLDVNYKGIKQITRYRFSTTAGVARGQRFSRRRVLLQKKLIIISQGDMPGNYSIFNPESENLFILYSRYYWTPPEIHPMKI